MAQDSPVGAHFFLLYLKENNSIICPNFVPKNPQL